MTYTILAKCPETDRLGVGIATYSLGVGGYCPFFARGHAVLSTQAFANPRLGPLALASLVAGASPGEGLKHLEGSDTGYDHGQFSIGGADRVGAMHNMS